MKKGLTILIISIMISFSLFIPQPKKVFAVSNKDAVIVMGGEISGNEVVVRVNLVENPNISSLNLEVVYDETVFTLENVIQGNALGELEYTTTNTDTAEGFSRKPFNIMYSLGSNVKNDDSTGTLFTMFFTIKDDIKDGNYRISLKKVTCIYIDKKGELPDRKVYIDPVEIKIKGSAPIEVNTITRSESSKKVDVVLIVAASIFGVSFIIAIVYFVTKKKKHWKKI